MKQRFASIRYRYIISHLNALFLTTVTILSILLTIHVLFNPTWLTSESIFLFISLYITLAIIFSFYVGFKSSGDLKERLDYLSVLITQFANGNYSSKVYSNEADELARIGNELNELGEKLQNQVKSLQRMADEKGELAKTAHKSAVIEERQRLARDLHDAVSQQLFALTMMSEAAVKQLDKDPKIAKDQMKDVAAASLQAQTEMRALLLHLRPVHLSGDPLPKGIQKLVSELKQKSQIDFHVSMDENIVLSEAKEEHIFRIVQESLSNTLRHANATEVTLAITRRANELFIHIRDNGKGFDSTNDSVKKTSYGLKTMKERCEELGGTFTIRSNVNEGTYIDIRIPC
ncbi:two-component system, NarL family, sensor histidine kinase LiaS [Oceanobacillus limi]|uniref:Sensor histidine kinase n=1 Tax=Oceanobacillus limi TaxID=930131 RepID=A0A1H9YN95_9BACI|nr:sensor histidine kinase [Oceanobacillus limi]SES69971.1 two-component system, NarL family, sensor histidine kinase LiaS [Oceanobacillus limi]